MESPTFDSFDVAAVKIEASEECSNNANTDFNNLCWLKKETNQDQVDDVLLAAEQKYQFNDDLNNILDPSMIKSEEHVNLNNQNNMPCIKSELNGAEGKENNDHDHGHDEIEIKTENNHHQNNILLSFDDFGPETSVDELVPEEKLNDSSESNEEVVPMETTISSSPSLEVTTNTFDELNFQEKVEEVIITPSSDLDDDSVDKQLSSVDNTNTISEEEEHPEEKMVFEHEENLNSPKNEEILKSPEIEDILKSPENEEILKSPESEPEQTIDQNIYVEEKDESMAAETVAQTDIDDNKNSFVDEIHDVEEPQPETHVESTMNDSNSKVNFVEANPHDSGEESDEEWNYMKAKEGQTEKENNVLREEFKENIEPEPVTEKEISSVELKEQVEEVVCAAAVDNLVAPKTPEPVLFAVDDLPVTPEMTDESNFHLNPEAKEFVPTAYTSPTSTEPPQLNGDMETLQVKQPYRHVFDDVVAQSPRKGRESNMDDLQLPAENDFDNEIAERPHELLDDDVKLPEAEAVPEPMEPVVEPQTENELLIHNALDNVGMKDSLYVENTSSGFNNGEVDLLNTIQTLPTEEIEDNNVLSNKEGLSLEIDEKDVISPCADEAKEIVTEIEEKIQEMHIQEPVENNGLDSSFLANVSQPNVDIDVSMEVHEDEPVVVSEPVVEAVPEPVQEPVVEAVPEPVVTVPETVPEPEPVKEQPVPVPEEPKITTNGDINVEELNKKNLEESAKLDAPAKIEDSKLLEATLGVVAVTAAATAAVKAKKSPAGKPSAATKKPTAPTTTAAKKPSTTSATAAARPKTAPVKSLTAERKPATTTSRTSSVTSAAKPRVEVKKTTTTSTLSKPKEVTKTTEIRKTTTTTTTSARSTVPKAASATTARPRPSTASSLTNGISKTKTTTTTSSTLKSASSTTGAAPKPRLSPRSTVSSTLRKAETLKSPSAAKPAASRIDSGLKSATKPAVAATTKTSTLRATTKPTTTTSSTTTTSNRLGASRTPTSTPSQRKTASPLDKKKALAPTSASSARKSMSLTKTPTKSPGAKPITKPAPQTAAVEQVAEAPAPPPEVVAAPPAVDIPIA